MFLRLRLLLLCFDPPPLSGPIPQILADLAQIRKDAEDCKYIADEPVTPGNSGFALGIGCFLPRKDKYPLTLWRESFC